MDDFNFQRESCQGVDDRDLEVMDDGLRMVIIGPPSVAA